MRTFHHIKLIDEIVRNPFETIGQRRYGLFRNYISSFVYNTEIKYNSEIKFELEALPSIEEFVAKEFGETHHRTVMFDYYLRWIAEDEKEFFNLCIDRIYEYEKTFPFRESEYTFELKVIENLDLRNSLKTMFYRPRMFGIEQFSDLRAFLDGYYKFKTEYSLPLSVFENKLLQMISEWKSKTNPMIPFDTWDRIFMKQVGTTDFCNQLKWEIERFEEILMETIHIKLSDANIIR